MIKRVAVILALAYLSFVCEFILYNVFGPWGKPELLILLFIFFNLYLGIRYSLVAAIAAGFLRDASSVSPFGTYLFVYVAGAYCTTVVNKYLYQPGSRFSRVMVALVVVLFCFTVELVLHMIEYDVRLTEVLTYVLWPQLVTTMVAATFVFLRMRDVSVFFALKSK